MREDDKPKSDLGLWDTLLHKTKRSYTSMARHKVAKTSPRECHKDKTCDYLMEMMARNFGNLARLGASVAVPAEKPPKKTKRSPTTETGQAKQRLYFLNRTPRLILRKDKDRRDRSSDSRRPPSQDHKSRPCLFHFRMGGCSNGKGCLLSHPKKHAPRAASANPGKRGGPSQNEVSF